MPRSTAHPSNGGIGIRLNQKRNKFSFREIAQANNSCSDIFFLYVRTNALIPQRRRFTPGPANAISVLCRAVAPAGIETYAGPRKKKGEAIILSSTPKMFPSPFLFLAPAYVSIPAGATALQSTLIAFAGPRVNLLLWGISALRSE